MEGVGGRFDEEHAEPGVRPEQAGDEVLVAAPHAVPFLEGQHHQVGHNTLR
jgi:hypothetical protein